MTFRQAAALLIPIAACGMQWQLWDGYIQPYVWFLFFPSAFLSAWLGGLYYGIAGTVIGTGLVWYVFIPPRFSFALKGTSSISSALLFLLMGVLYAWFFERLSRAQRRTEEALVATSAANERITELYRRTLELDELKSQFFANVSHELRTPLTLIMSPLALRAQQPDRSAEDRRQDEMMLRNARMLYRHVSDLLDAAKMEAGGMTVDYARFDLMGLARTTAAQFDSLSLERGLTFVVEGPDALMVEADSEMILRIVVNLLSNAFKFTPVGGRVVLRIGLSDDAALIQVEDNGPGVPASMKEAVFERFRQIDSGTNRRHGGTGLGLAIVKEFARLHGGDAWAGDAPETGALFHVRLPLHAPAGADVREGAGDHDPIIDLAMTDELRPQRPTGETGGSVGADAPLVLIVEDNADMNGFIADALRTRYRVACAFNGQEGLEMALRQPPDVILSDVMMPVMGGDRMVEELRRRPEFLDLPIVILTAKADDALRVSMFQLGVQGHLTKPFAVEELLARIGTLVATRRRTLDELRRLNADLEQRVAERTAELSGANQELEAFAYAVSHDLRAPLRAMSGFAVALQEDFGDKMAGEASEFLDEIIAASGRMGDLIDGILALSRSTRGGLARSDTDLSCLAETILVELGRAESGRRVRQDVQPGLSTFGDAVMLAAVMRNLIGNAWKYSASNPDAQIRVYGEDAGAFLRICVADNGAGFDMQHADKLYKPFQRLHRQDEFPGVGIGLATAQRIIRRHGGEITATAARDRGATFCFTLPKTPRARDITA